MRLALEDKHLGLCGSLFFTPCRRTVVGNDCRDCGVDLAGGPPAVFGDASASGVFSENGVGEVSGECRVSVV